MPIKQACKHLKRYEDIKQVVEEPTPDTRAQHKEMFDSF